MRKILTLIFTSFLFYSAQADTFIVTSNADSGAGTLREAIGFANANGTAVTDYIHFNIADQSVTGRTILVASPFADLTSKIVIDGSTQPGVKFGVSDAKIRLSNPAGVATEYLFRIIGAGDIEFYGLHFNALTLVSLTGNCIVIRNAFNIKVGAPAKGNYFTNVAACLNDADLHVRSRGLSTGVSFKSNILNLKEDGTGIEPGSFAGFGLTNIKNLEIGGDQPNEGNYMVTTSEYIVTVVTDTTATNIDLGYTKIMNNKFGCNFTETAALTCGTISLVNSRPYGAGETSRITVKNNSFNSTYYTFSNTARNFLVIGGKHGFFDIKSNRIGLLGAPVYQGASIISTAFAIGDCEDGIIGGDGPADQNIITSCNQYAIVLGGNKNVKITKNSIFCNYKGISALSDYVTIPKVKIFTITDYLVAGTTAANCVVEVFLTQTCRTCDNGKTYLGNTTSDASGNWSFTSAVLLDGAVTATATTQQGVTGEFAKPEFSVPEPLVKKLPTCNLNNGEISGMQFVAGTRYYWLRNNTDTIYTLDIMNAAPGYYKFVVEQGKYCNVSLNVDMGDISPRINDQYKLLRDASCGQNNGSISNIAIRGSYNKILWKDLNNNIVGRNVDLLSVGAGQYKLIILDTTYGCGDSTNFFLVSNQSGPSLNTNNIQITPATCSNSNGSIKGITAANVTGVPFFKWLDSTNNTVGNAIDLVNIPPGKYRLKFKDNAGCDTIVTGFYLIADKGAITIDTSNKLITASKCSGNTGSIQQLIINGAQTFTWTNTATNAVVGNAANVYNLPSGNYILSLSNSSACSKTSPVFFVPPAAFSPIAVTSYLLGDAVCNQKNGFAQVQSFSNNATSYSFSWRDSITGQVIGTGTKLDNLNAGSYQLFATDSNACEKKIFSAVIKNLPVPTFDYSQVQIKPDNCSLINGSISSLSVNNLKGPTVYAWYDQQQNLVGNTFNLNNTGAGTYTLKITDAGFCNILSTPFTISTINNELPAPVYDDLIIPRYSTAGLLIKNPATGNYRLMDNSPAMMVLANNDKGNFTIPNITTDTSFLVKRIYGACESKAVRINIKVVDKSFFAIPTGFTPNGDGLNDRLNVRVTGFITLSNFSIYNKWGELVFQTSKLNTGWDGFYKGVLQNTGSFIWIAEGKDINGNSIKDRGSFTLIR